MSQGLLPGWDELVSTSQHSGCCCGSKCAEIIQKVGCNFALALGKGEPKCPTSYSAHHGVSRSAAEQHGHQLTWICGLLWDARLGMGCLQHFVCELAGFLVIAVLSCYCSVISCLFWMAGLWRSEFVTYLYIICGHCLFQIHLWSWGIRDFLEMRQTFVRFPPTTVVEKSITVLAISFWYFMVCFCCDSKTQVAHDNVNVPSVYFCCCCGSFILDLPECGKSGNRDHISVV